MSAPAFNSNSNNNNSPDIGDEKIDPAELAAAEEYHSQANFIKMHKPQFMSMKLPANLMQVVYTKLLNTTFDAPEVFEVQSVEDEGYRVVVAKEGGLKAGKDVWILDHMWTTSIAQGPKQLKEIDGLIERVWELADMDRHLAEDRAEAIAEAAAATSSTATSTSTSSATPAAASVELDEESLSAIMAAASVSRESAIDAYRANSGDLINSIASFQGKSEREMATQAHMERVCEEQANAQLNANASTNLALIELDNLTLDQRVELLWTALFRHTLIGSYFTTIQSNVKSSSLTQADVQTTLYVNELIGSAVRQTLEPANACAVQHHLVCVTLGGVGFTLMWLTEDLEEGDEVVIPRRPQIRLPGVPWPKQ